jgi:hypothetical protein
VTVATTKEDVAALSLQKRYGRCPTEPIRSMSFGWGPPMTVQNDQDHHSDYGPAQLALFGAAAVVLFIFAWAVIS